MDDSDPSARQRQAPRHDDVSSRAAARYSPMMASPTTPYHSKPPSAAGYTAYAPPPPQQSRPPRYYPATPSRAGLAPLSPLQTTISPVQPFPQLPRSGTTPSERSGVPRFSRCHAVAELQPTINPQPAFRRLNPEGGFVGPLQGLTTQLAATYRICNPQFQYLSSRNPRRVLTKPSKGVRNDGYDNEDSDYILYVNDILGSEETNHKNRYLILDVLGQGTFGQVVKCQNLKTGEVVAVKVVKNKTAYFNQSMMEVSVLDLLNTRMDKNDDHHILRLKDTFIHKQHLCLVFELLSVNLYELVKQNQFRGLSTTLVRVFAQQLLNGLCLLSKARLIHCDLKPENILLKNLESPIIKIIDFGSACDERQTVYTYIQSRFYRSPEVLLGLPYSAAIDMWSLGCIVVELFLGLPLFPGSSEYNQVSRINEMLGLPPRWMLEMGKQSADFYEKTLDEFGRRTFRLKSMEQYAREHNTKEQPSKKYFQASRLPDIIRTYPMPRKGMKQSEMDREMANREAFIDFVHGLLNLNPLERWSPQQARTHPFITQQKYNGPFQPQMGLKTPTSRSPAPGVQQQQQAEALSRQREHQQSQAYQPNNLPYTPNMYTPVPSAGPSSMYQSPYGQALPMVQPPVPFPNLYANPAPNTLGSSSSGRQRANTLDANGVSNGIPPALQRVVSHLDPNAPIRLQPSPAYYPPPQSGETSEIGNIGGRRRMSRATRVGNSDRNVIKVLEDRTLQEGWQAGNTYQNYSNLPTPLQREHGVEDV